MKALLRTFSALMLCVTTLLGICACTPVEPELPSDSGETPTDLTSESVPGDITDLNTETGFDPQPESEKTSETDPMPETEPMSEATAKPETKPKTETDPKIETDPKAETDPIPEPAPPADLTVIEGGIGYYRVVCGSKETSDIKEGRTQIVRAIETATTVRLSAIDDQTKYDAGVKEIIIGLGNNRPAAKMLSALAADSFCIQAVDGNIVIAGGNADALTAAVACFQKRFLSGSPSSLILPADLHISMTLLQWQTEDRENTVTLKQSYSDYVTEYEEITLIPFHAGDRGYSVLQNGFYDKANSIDGQGALRWNLKGQLPTVTRLISEEKNTFSFDASDRQKSTLKFWLYVSDTDMVACDHDNVYGIQQNQATFYFRAIDKDGRVYCWNHTITNNGWHEIELTFNVHNGFTEGFDFAHVTGFWFGLGTYGDVTIMMDRLRGVHYRTDYAPQAIEGGTNPRLISDCEYDALDGAVVQEWYGTSYDLADKVQGRSSLHNCGDSTVNDFRTIVANLEIPMDHERDVLVFHFKVADPLALKNILIELNQIQDVHEFQHMFSLEELKQYGFTGEKDTWCEIRIPLSVFEVSLKDGLGDTVTLKNFRFVGWASSDSVTFDYHIDHIYLAEK